MKQQKLLDKAIDTARDHGEYTFYTHPNIYLVHTVCAKHELLRFSFFKVYFQSSCHMWTTQKRITQTHMVL